MPGLSACPPTTRVDVVHEILHGMQISDPYRWLEDPDSPGTREWLHGQALYARAYLDSIAGRDRIEAHIRDLLDVETIDSLQKIGNRYFFRKRIPGQEQPSICFREGLRGHDQILVDPCERATGPHTAVRPICVSPNGRLLCYEVKQGGERTGIFEFLDVDRRAKLPEALPRGYLRGLVFTPGCDAFYYVHENREDVQSRRFSAYRHVLGTNLATDEEIFAASESSLRLSLVPGRTQFGALVFRRSEKTLTDFYLLSFQPSLDAEPILREVGFRFGPLFLPDGRILALTDRDAPNLRIVELHLRHGAEPQFVDLVPEDECSIQRWAVSAERIYVSYVRKLQTEIDVFDFIGRKIGQLPTTPWTSTRIVGSDENDDTLLLKHESFTSPAQFCLYNASEPGRFRPWNREPRFATHDFEQIETCFPAKDGISVPMFLVGHKDQLVGGPCPTIMTAYGGFGVSMTPQFSILVTLLLEHGCLFALPNIRGGSEFGAQWHHAAQRRDRQVAFDDFLTAAEWLIETRRTEPGRLAIFGGSNSGLLVGAAMTQRPELFCAVLCIAPILDMLRYHLFDGAIAWKEEFGWSEDPEDFSALVRYSPYQNVHDGISYPATMIVSGDSDQNCNPMHARKMTARLQAANRGGARVLLDYNPHRGHSPVLPLSDRVRALTDRVAFLCDQLQLR